jgi:hypothetical protein
LIYYCDRQHSDGDPCVNEFSPVSVFVTAIKHMPAVSLDQFRSAFCRYAFFGRLQSDSVIVDGPLRLTIAFAGVLLIAC